MIRTVLAPSFDLALTVPAPILLTVEAEYGAIVFEGTLYTAAHHQPHGPYAGNHVVEGGRPAPCNDTNIPELDSADVSGTILVSHIDLDTLGGVLRAEARRDLFAEANASFWALAEFVDVNGAHKMHFAKPSERDARRLYAWWAYAKTMPRVPRDQVTDVTDMLGAAGDALARIFEGDEGLLAAGDAFRAEEVALNKRTFRRISQLGVVTRIADKPNDFVNHLYTAPNGFAGGTVVAWNKANGSITISRAEPCPELSCRDMVQTLWGPEAGGHDGIAGSPRGRMMTEEEFDQALDYVYDRVLAHHSGE
jgi:hypothetical protein